MLLSEIELTAAELAKCERVGITPDELRELKILKLTPEVEAALDAIHAALPDACGHVCGPWEAEHHTTAHIGCIGDIEFEITGNVYLNAATGMRKLAADLMRAAEDVEAIQRKLANVA